jgi:AcrR family transcriptional regulator
MSEPTTLRERQAESVRTSVLEAVITQLETRALDDVSMAEIADAAGVSLRTLYRYFPDREALLQATGEHLYASLEVPYDIDGPDKISASFKKAARQLSTRAGLARTLVRTTAGRVARSAVRGRRVEAITNALRPLTKDMDAATARRATAVIAHLCGAASWVMIADETGLNDAEAQRAVAWAIDRLVESLHEPGL